MMMTQVLLPVWQAPFKVQYMILNVAENDMMQFCAGNYRQFSTCVGFSTQFFFLQIFALLFLDHPDL